MAGKVRTARVPEATLGAMCLVAAATAALPGTAAAGTAGLTQDTSAAARGDIAYLPEASTYRLSPQLAAMLGRTSVDAAGLRALRASLPGRPGLPGEPTPAVGTTLLWPALDTVNGIGPGIYLKSYTLKAVGKKIEVWVASGIDGVSQGIAFPAGDCRNNTPHSTEVTDAQIKYRSTNSTTSCTRARPRRSPPRGTGRAR